MEFKQKSSGDYVVNSKPEGYAVQIQLYYNKGGMNYFTGRQVRRGIYLAVNAVEIIDNGSYKTVRIVPTDGVRICLKELKRKSAKQIDLQKDRIEKRLTEIFDAFQSGNIRNTLMNLVNLV